MANGCLAIPLTPEKVPHRTYSDGQEMRGDLQLPGSAHGVGVTEVQAMQEVGEGGE